MLELEDLAQLQLKGIFDNGVVQGMAKLNRDV